MPKVGKRHRLMLYTYLLNRWRQAILAIGITLLLLVAGLVWLPPRLPQYSFFQPDKKMLWLGGGAGGIMLLLTLFLGAIRRSAYVQPFDNHLKLATPFLQMDISYRRILQITSAELGRLFSLEKLKGRKLDMLRPIARRTALVIELKGWPLPRWVLGMFLSPFFFPDDTPRIALLVPDWMAFSDELESYRTLWGEGSLRPGGSPQTNLLASLNKYR